MLSVQALSKSYHGPQGRTVLRDLGLDVAGGDFVAIMGESGSGKSTLLNLIAGLDTPDTGRVLLDGADLATLPDAERTRRRRRDMGFIFQAFHLLPHLSVAQNVALPLALNGIDPAARAPRVTAMLDAVGLGARADSFPRQLSGGQMQRVAVARALVHAPKLLLADEPTGNLDEDSAGQIMALLREQVRTRGCGALLVTHSRQAAAFADRVLLLSHGALAPARP